MKKKYAILVLFICTSIFSQSEKIEVINISTVEITPIYEGCENYNTNESRIKCMDESLVKLIKNNYDFKITKCLKEKKMYVRNKGVVNKCISKLLPGEKRIYLDFIISDTGDIKNITARAPDKKLELEAIRVGKLIPKIIPAKRKGVPIEMPYSVPIDFTIE